MTTAKVVQDAKVNADPGQVGYSYIDGKSEEFEYIPKEPSDFVKVMCKISSFTNDEGKDCLNIQYKSFNSDFEFIDNFSLTYEFIRKIAVDFKKLWSAIRRNSNLDYKSIKSFLDFQLDNLIFKAYAE